MTKLSVNINKFATLRNARGGNLPDVIQAAKDCERFGAQGITVHPRPDERHIRYKDAIDLKPVLKTEFNVEGNPIDSFIKLVLDVRPAQVTLVPDSHDVITSNCGWNTKKHLDFLKKTCKLFANEGIRTSIFVDPDTEMVKYAAETGCDRIELYTEAYAKNYLANKESAIEPYIKAAVCASEYKLGLNAGHDLSLENLRYFQENINGLLEVSIGHALICEAIYLGLENTIQAYLRELKNY
ncbi:MAG: pyridoxine 5'-phosphate synthase [Bacteroidetes bacterium HGW-Bacteroidetes-7]|jgi:pyridoxine 5-phosphate synthase|nr:MAG: pyridoxine 5'-phosphate synthase [Bacteroidetes bacterium HGW-Bacteroidetes-7]